MDEIKTGGQVSTGTPVNSEEKKLRLLITDDSRLLRKKLREELELSYFVRTGNCVYRGGFGE